ncbi:C40 family peptidase [Homoserinibacter sp. YIM 151385]|uniref:C40 family peptidase n=1 Tax=Homoserinibacter sp. YIM 151385 TaxID=2985506 RepID=UPI0022EFE23F|nr:C40 family peptidase [Homoserinibacter sp. YIM 151385]WBU37546.1 C40 family peptidase [Homoserinibacter sp. YIM 151385]
MTESRRRPRGTAAAIGAGALVLALTTPSAAVAVDDYPSWDDVEKARKNEADKRAQIEKIERLIRGLDREAADLGRVALERGEAYHLAQDALETATAEADEQYAAAEAAQRAAEESRQRAAGVIAQLARAGGGDITATLLTSSAEDADRLLERLGLMTRVSRASAELLRTAIFDRNAAEQLADGAAAAEDERDERARSAKALLREAEAAAKDASGRAAERRKAEATLIAQLARLKGTTADTERGYREGLAWEREQEEQKEPPADPGDGDSGTPGAPPVDPTPPAPPVTGKVDGAIAFAKAQIGEPYRLGGAGPNVWDCSGLTKTAYANVGVYIGTHSATNQYSTMAAQGRLVKISQIKAGDLLFYSSGGSASGSKYHVTLYIGGGQMIEAPYPGETVRIRAVRYGDLVPYAGRPTG